MNPLKYGLINREAPYERGQHGVCPVVLASAGVECGAPRGEKMTLKASRNGFHAEFGWSNPRGRQDDQNAFVVESISHVRHLLSFPNEQIKALAQFYIEVAQDVYSPEPGTRTSHRAGAA